MMITCLSPQSPTSPEKTCVINEPLLMHTRLAEKTALRTGKPLVACHNEYRSQSEGRTQRTPHLKQVSQSLEESMTRLIDISEDSRHPYQGMLASSAEKEDHDHCMEQRRRLET